MIAYLRVLLRGWLIVFLTAANIAQVSAHHYPGAFLCGGAISIVWWWNSSAKREQIPGAAFTYGLGAALGTISGMALTQWWYR